MVVEEREGLGRLRRGERRAAGQQAQDQCIEKQPAQHGRALRLPVYGRRAAAAKRQLRWSSGVELVAVDTKDRVDANRNELRTPGYALVNLRTAYEWRNVRLDLGVDNLLDKLYYAPLAGADWADYNAVGGRIGPVPGMGRSFNAGLTVRF
ncbi:MAG: TonB-dependent receptor [Hyphomicrobiaceae bacterium]|nr:TonB-dependent receptor [Hyphomicrobiaceae bacterium]